MDVLILAAGYATRLYPLTLNQAKPLLPVAGKSMIDHVLQSVLSIEGIDKIYVVTNAKFANDFEKWAKIKTGLNITIVNDGSTTPENALGAIGDINFVRRTQKLSNDLLIVAGDNLFSEKLQGFGQLAKAKQEALLGVYDVKDLEAIKKYNNISIDKDGKIVAFEEKPTHPTSTLTGIALYYYPKDVLQLLDAYIQEGNNPDQPGRFVQWLYTRRPVYTWNVPGIWFDIGSKETLEEAGEVIAGLSVV